MFGSSEGFGAAKYGKDDEYKIQVKLFHAKEMQMNYHAYNCFS